MDNAAQGKPGSGRANTVLVFGQSEGAVAVVSSVIVRIVDQAIGDRIRFSGPSTFEDKTINHVTSVILPMVDRVCEILGLPKKNFIISVVNLGAASIMDVSLRISGYSADAPIALAMLSARVEMEVPQSIAVTGHIASVDGDITMVTSIPAKLEAAMKEETIYVFIHPSLEKDGSLDSLSPNEKQRIAGAIATAKRSIRLIGVKDISDLVKAAFSDEQIALASLRQGFYEGLTPGAHTDSPIGKAANLLGVDNEARFWKSLERQLMEGRNEDIGNLLHGLANFHLEQKAYPKNFGCRLLQLIHSLPPETRRFKVDFPLLHMTDCIQLSQFAKESDHEDVKSLFKATSGEISQQLARISGAGGSDDAGDDDGSERGRQILLSIQSEISADALVSITQPIDLARATYSMGSVVVETNDEFNDATTAYFVHLKRHTRKMSEPIPVKDAGAESLALIERAFAQSGGLKNAFAEAKSGTRGGLSYVLTMMTNQYKKEAMSKHVNWVLKSGLDPLDFNTKTAVVTALMEDLGHHLPPDIADQPPERFSNFWDRLVSAYCESLDQVCSLFRSL